MLYTYLIVPGRQHLRSAKCRQSVSFTSSPQHFWDPCIFIAWPTVWTSTVTVWSYADVVDSEQFRRDLQTYGLSILQTFET